MEEQSPFLCPDGGLAAGWDHGQWSRDLRRPTKDVQEGRKEFREAKKVFRESFPACREARKDVPEAFPDVWESFQGLVFYLPNSLLRLQAAWRASMMILGRLFCSMWVMAA